MTADLTSTTTIDFISILSQTTAAYREGSKLPNAELVVNALLAAEKTAKQQKLNYAFDSLCGKWRLCFATGTKKVRRRGGIILGKGFYVPKLAKIHISLNAENRDLVKGDITNQVQLGSILLKLTGPTQYIGKKNLLAFDFNKMQISLFNRVIYNQSIRSGKVPAKDFYEQSIAKLPFFTFFIVTPDFIAARGRGGGLAIWIRD
jgi:hypothetical protein